MTMICESVLTAGSLTLGGRLQEFVVPEYIVLRLEVTQ